MIPSQLHVEPGQEERIKCALHKRKGCRIKVRKTHGGGPHSLLLRKAHVKRYNKAAPGSVIALPFRHEELVANMHHKGGFLPLILAALAPMLGGLLGGLIEKKVSGRGLPQLYTMTSQGSGLYLNPWKGGSGLYLNPWKGGSHQGII